MDKTILADAFYNQIAKYDITEPTIDSFQDLSRLLNRFFNAVTQEEKLQFATQFARISFVCHKYEFQSLHQWYVHEFRHQAKQILFKKKPFDPTIFTLGYVALVRSIEEVCKTVIPTRISENLPQGRFYKKNPIKVKAFKERAKVVVLKVQEEASLLICQDEEVTDQLIKVRFDEASSNEIFTPTIQAMRYAWQHHATFNLLDIQIDEEGVYHPQVFVLEPDYLFDVSAIAMCFSNSGANPYQYLVSKFLPHERKTYLMLGNIANFFLDELMNNPKTTFNATFPKVFSLNPIAFTLFSDAELKEIMHEARIHFTTLKNMVIEGFSANDINPEDCYLEPSFYAEKYGIQGRLDVWYQNPESEQNSAIIELKSGKIFNPNRYGINESHYVQALLYDLLIKTTFSQKDPRNYILYSKVTTDNLRFAPAVKSKQNEAIALRNQLMAIEQMLINLHESQHQGFTILDKLSPARFPNGARFFINDLEAFSKVYFKLNPTEKAYFTLFTSFIAREHQLAKTGLQGNDRINGLASLWLNPYAEKEESYEILSYLTITHQQVKLDAPIIIFEKDAIKTNPLANFRQGDIAILYPANDPETGNAVLQNQIFKCTIIDISPSTVSVQLRYKQFNETIFNTKNTRWVLEHDMLDHSFNAMYRSLFTFFSYPELKKSLLLTERPPAPPSLSALEGVEQLKGYQLMTDEQQKVFQKAMLSPEFFLLWGPPGTGKTSLMLHTMIEYILTQTEENILILAYTNRAVDEICAAIEAVGSAAQKNYIRIGSVASCSEAFRHALFDKKTEAVTSRKGLRAVINSHRFFVSTVASISNKKDLMELKTFTRVIIDEASQILEPMLVGLLPLFKQVILIGDHKQLPAVVQQDKSHSVIQVPSLVQLGLNDMRDSLFERLFFRFQQEKWDWAFDKLSFQGRMHQDIMAFPNQFFYENNLKILPPSCEVPQHQPINYQTSERPSILEKAICQQRFLYFTTQTDEESITGKTNVHEANLIGELVDSFYNLFKQNNLPIQYHKTIGIITPYRAQIAQIRQVLERYGKGYENFTVDTVERYQGSARDIILLSLCLNTSSQLETLVSLSTDGQVDRKLNVALTRAKKHLVVVGNQEVMELNPIYKQLIEFCQKENGSKKNDLKG